MKPQKVKLVQLGHYFDESWCDYKEYNTPEKRFSLHQDVYQVLIGEREISVGALEGLKIQDLKEASKLVNYLLDLEPHFRAYRTDNASKALSISVPNLKTSYFYYGNAKSIVIDNEQSDGLIGEDGYIDRIKAEHALPRMGGEHLKKLKTDLQQAYLNAYHRNNPDRYPRRATPFEITALQEMALSEQGLPSPGTDLKESIRNLKINLNIMKHTRSLLDRVKQWLGLAPLKSFVMNKMQERLTTLEGRYEIQLGRQCQLECENVPQQTAAVFLRTLATAPYEPPPAYDAFPPAYDVIFP